MNGPATPVWHHIWTATHMRICSALHGTLRNGKTVRWRVNFAKLLHTICVHKLHNRTATFLLRHAVPQKRCTLYNRTHYGSSLIFYAPSGRGRCEGDTLSSPIISLNVWAPVALLKPDNGSFLYIACLFGGICAQLLPENSFTLRALLIICIIQ